MKAPVKAFKETTTAAGAAFQQRGVGRGAAFGDLDNDGRMDIVVTNNNGPVRALMLNQDPQAIIIGWKRDCRA